jgi:putative DNA primase/helicase
VLTAEYAARWGIARDSANESMRVLHGPLTLDAADPLPSARAFVARDYRVDGAQALYHQGGSFFAYRPDVGTYQEHDEPCIKADLYRFLEGARRTPKPGSLSPLQPFQPTRAKVQDVLDALRAVCHLPASKLSPCWLHSDYAAAIDPFDVLPFRNGLLYIPRRQLLASTPRFFALNGIDFSYDPEAPEPVHWLGFLHDLWPGDAQSQETLQECIGYLLTPRTHFQKCALIVGPKRSGKGTIARVTRRLIGERNVCGPTLSHMGEQFGLSTLIGKSVGIIADARSAGEPTRPS